MTRNIRRHTWKIAWPMICLYIVLVKIPLFLSTGGQLKSYYASGSYDARAKEAKLSIIKLTQSIWGTDKIDCLKIVEDIMLKIHTTTLTVSWNCKNLLMLRKIFLPQTTDLTMQLMSSYRITISAAFLATWVPDFPIAIPTSALIRAGTSLVPSPVTATTLLNFFRV